MAYEREKSEIQLLRAHLLATIPSTPLSPAGTRLAPNSLALRAAVAGLDKELVRLEREERLAQKFAATNDGATRATVAVAAVNTVESADAEYVKMTKEDAVMEDTNDDAAKGEDEWEDGGGASPTPAEERTATLAAAAVARIAGADARVGTPLGALGLALHAALVASTAEGAGKEALFRCTGVPDAAVVRRLVDAGENGGGGGGGGGFAPPIRELPQGVLLPPKWEQTEGAIAFRYNCGKGVYSVDIPSSTNDATTVYLTLKLLPSEEGGEEAVSVTFGTLPSTATGTAKERKRLQFPLGQHVNLEGFTAAKAKHGASVAPALFYVALVPLLSRFCSQFSVWPCATRDVGAVAGTAVAWPRQIPGTGEARAHPKSVLPSAGHFSGGVARDPLRVMHAPRRCGDFEGDLLPGGPRPGGVDPLLPHGGGNQVGPGHPLFDRQFGDYEDDFGGGFGNGGGSLRLPGVGGGMGGMGMHPRFDPYGPPGGPTEPGRGGHFPGRGDRTGHGRGRGGRGRRGGRGQGLPGGFGNPNPDHMTPPGGDYFS